jgi:succinate dehydrogenase / fumarate reductase, iron-sulfur subunit
LAEDPAGIYDCTHSFVCVEVFPKDGAPMGQIMRLRRRATAAFGIEDQNNGYGHENAFTRLIERYGSSTRPNCCLVPTGGSLVKALLSPSGRQGLAGSLPTAARARLKGKISPRKALAAPEAAGPEAGTPHLQASRVQGRAPRAQPEHRR